MKSLFPGIVWLLAFTGSAYSQYDPNLMRLNKVPDQGVELNQGWKFHEGDDTAWANPYFDDSSWQKADLTLYSSYLFQFTKKGIGWFRTRIILDSSLLNAQLAILISQEGASEIYLNGHLFEILGKLSAKAGTDDLNPHDKPILLPVNLRDSMSLAIRFRSRPPWPPKLYPDTGSAPLTVKIAPWFSSLNHYRNGIVMMRTPIGFSFMSIGLGLLFIFLYSFFPKEKINLIFGIFCMLLSVNSFAGFQLSEGNLDIRETGQMLFFWMLAAKSCGILILSIILLEVFDKVPWHDLSFFFYVLVVDSLIQSFFQSTTIARWSSILSRMFFAVEFLRCGLFGFLKGHYILGIVSLSSAILNANQVIPFFNPHYIPGAYDSFNWLLCLIMLSIYLANKYARNSRHLAVQLAEINKLAQSNQEKEREKQQILAAQNEELEKQVQERTTALFNSLEELKDTQAQLIQSEKMASLGELTAGIAHEIQNPLNFVNNFSEVNAELIEEMNKDLESGNLVDAKKVSEDIRQNLEKINHHGKRADSIVKSMLQHSRASTGQKEPTDLNALVDEYLRLAYHGLRAKDKTFNATLRTEYDEGMGSVSLIPQDIGRALLNLFNNAFYSISEKKRTLSEISDANQKVYEPTLTVSTRRITASEGKQETQAEIRVRDNGLGISQKIIDKVFQPFFTSKPTGHGTGLGLSLTYDIISKVHGGQLTINSKEGEFAEFIILLPT
ncbi:MAG: ATP-binding protein [Chitinophagales bacterium]